MTAMIATISRGMIPHMHRHSLLRSSLGVGAATVLSRTIRNTTTVAALALIRSAAATTHPLQHQLQYYSHLEQCRSYSTSIDPTLTVTKKKRISTKRISENKTLDSVHIDNLESIGWTKLRSLGRYLGLTYILTKAEIIKKIKSHIESTPSMLLPDGFINFESTMFTHHQIYPEGLHSVKVYQLHSLCSALGISVWNSNDELIDEIYLHIKRNPSAMAGNSTVDLLSNDTVDDSTSHTTTKQSMSAVLKRLQTCDRQQLNSLCSSFGISALRSQDILVVTIQDHLRENPSLLSPNGTIPLQLLLSHCDSQSKPMTVNSLTQLGKYQLWTFSDICGIPYHFTKADFAGIIKNQLLDSVSPLVEEGVMVNLQFTPKLSRKEISDISDMSIHINRLEALSHAQLVTFCKMFGVSSAKPKDQLVEELRLYLTSNPYAVTEDGVLIPGNEKSIDKRSSKKTLSKPVYLHSLDTSHQDDIWVICRSYGISEKISKEQLLERFRTHLHKHPEIMRADGAIDLVALADTKG